MRKYPLEKMPVTESVFMKTGVLPVHDHFYQPLINPGKHLLKSLRTDRSLPGIDWNVNGQLNYLKDFRFNHELLEFPIIQKDTHGHAFYYDNKRFCSGDAEYYYNFIRLLKPKRIVEIGSGMSTLMALNAIKKNLAENSLDQCEIICIEPYQSFWLESLSVNVVRKKVEELSAEFFLQLNTNDILFIDSSHIIRPQGDVLFEYLTVLPLLKSGVIIHAHDIFTPKDYLDEWIRKDHKLWNEQYLLEAFLSFNNAFQIIGALNFLHHNYRDALAEKCPVLRQQPDREPGSFWFRKI